LSQTISNPVFDAQRRAPMAAAGPSGFLAVAKPSGITSFDVIRELRRITRVKKQGHSGVLDRPASGVLVVGFNKATRLFEFFSGMEKEYIGDFWLGLNTTTDDLTGELTDGASEEVRIERAAFELELGRFRGGFDQLPPAFSLTKKAGKEMYRYALAGEEVEVEPKHVSVIDSHVIEFEQGADVAAALPLESKLEPVAEGLPPLTRARVGLCCTGGLYVRSLARDIGAALGVRGSLGELIRTRVGPFTLEQSITLDDLAARMDGGEPLSSLLLPLSSIAPHEARINLDGTQVSMLRNGRAIRRFAAQLPPGATERGDIAYGLDPRGELIAVLQVGSTGQQGLTELRPLKVIN
jgi:tRNA pseudouridine55 synthase